MKAEMLKILIGVILGLFLGLQIRSCVNNTLNLPKFSLSTPNKKQPVILNKRNFREVSKEIVKETDTVYITSKPKVIFDTIYMNQNQEFIYNINENDLKGSIVTKLVGESLEQKLNYSVICPTITNTETITITIRDSTIVEVEAPRKNKLYFGGGANFNETLLGPNLNFTLQLKNDYQVSYNYNVFFNNNANTANFHSVTLKIPLRLNVK